MRTLRYATNSDTLFFSTTLQNAVQLYDLKHSKLLDPAHTHPSPPTVFAISSTSHLLLSASVSPPIIQLTNLILKTRPLFLKPQCSASAVIIGEFHPERGNIFMLVFADGTCAVYDAAYIFRDGGHGERRSETSGSGNGWEIAHIRKLHAPGGTATERKGADPSTNEYDVEGGASPMGDQSLSVRAVAFVPGRKATAVTVGSDGRCCIVDFSVATNREAHVLHSWHVEAPATSLSILSLNTEDGSALPKTAPKARIPQQDDYLVAIGRRDGMVVLFDLNGNWRSEKIFDPYGSSIIDVDWMIGDDWPEPRLSQPRHVGYRTSDTKTKRKSLGSMLAGGRQVVEEIVAVFDEADADQAHPQAVVQLSDSPELSSTPKIDDLAHTPATSHEKNSSLLKTDGPTDGHFDDMPGQETRSWRESPPTDLLGQGDTIIDYESRLWQSRSLSDHSMPERNNSWAHEQYSRESKDIAARGLSQTRTPFDTQANEIQQPYGTASRRSSRPATGLGLSAPYTQDDRLTNDKKGLLQESRIVWKQDDNFLVTMAETGEDVWTDIVSHDGPHDGRTKLTTSSDKENQSPHDASEANSSDQIQAGPSGPHLNDMRTNTKTNQKAQIKGFSIYNDDNDYSNHPQPLSAHPKKSPSSGPLAPTNINTSRFQAFPSSSARRAQFKTSSENKRASYSGPGALIRRVQQDIMIAVNIELENLRREMGEKIAAQKQWFQTELEKTHIWALRVEEENRKLREELAKGRKKGEGWKKKGP